MDQGRIYVPEWTKRSHVLFFKFNENKTFPP